MTAAPKLSTGDVADFLSGLHGERVDEVEPLTGGFWSSAFGYTADSRELVVRFGEMRHGFEADRAAFAHAGPDLPVPEVLDIGDAFGASYAISVRAHGRFLEDLTVEEAEAGGEVLARLLAALRVVQGDGSGSWREWVRGGLVDHADHPTAGWRVRLAEDPELDELFRTCEARVEELLPRCPERRDLVHADLLHRNVLLAEDLSRVTAVFSWKCSTWGDFLHDVAWCGFWGAVAHPGIAAADPFGRVVTELSVSDPSALAGGADRHHCYELQIGAGHLGWHTWTGDHAARALIAARLRELLEAGPRPMPAP